MSREIQYWPQWMKIVAVLVVVYILLFVLPELWLFVKWVRKCFATGNLELIGREVVQLALNLLTLMIWLASIWLSAQGLRVTKKKAYAFILSYLLLCTVLAPLGYMGNMFIQRQQARAWPQAVQGWHVLAQTEEYPAGTGIIHLPIDALLLLAATWFFCKTDGVPLRTKNEGRC